CARWAVEVSDYW
nr:immunoglobulin heavy chain junction region [Macaca mulatta]